MFFKQDPSLTSINEKSFESRLVLTHPFTRTPLMGRSDFNNLIIFVRFIINLQCQTSLIVKGR
jgi:hypothetical protein